MAVNRLLYVNLFSVEPPKLTGKFGVIRFSLGNLVDDVILQLRGFVIDDGR